jgi:polysaccharide export outer membrane protein
MIMYRQWCAVVLLFLVAFFGKSGAAIIGEGDILDIQVLQHAEYSGRYTVNEPGTIDYPLYSDHAVVNTNTVELAQELTFLLARHIDNPLVTVTVVKNPEILVTVLGQVQKPGQIKTVEGATVQEVLVAAGGILPEKADLSTIKIIRKKRPNQPETANLELFLQNGDMQEMPLLSNADVVVVLTKEKSDRVKVIGAVQKPGLFLLEEKMNLFEIIYLAGGPSEKADLTRVRKISRDTDEKVTEEIIDIQKFIDDGKMENIPVVAYGDVVIVYNKWFDWKVMLTVLNNTLLFIVTIQAFAGIFK